MLLFLVMNTQTIFLIVLVCLATTTILYAGYMKATSFICVEEIPPTYLVNNNPEIQTSITKCEGGFLMKLNLNYPLN